MKTVSEENSTTPVECRVSAPAVTASKDLLEETDPQRVQAGNRAPSPADDKRLIKQEKELVDRCVRGDVAAWEELYHKHHPALLRSISVLLGTKGTDRNLIDELAAQVWYSLVEEDGELLGRFCPNRGARLNTFIRAVAKDVTSRYSRAEQRRHQREFVAVETGLAGLSHCEEPDDSLSDFLSTLTETERQFTEAYLLSARNSDGEEDSGRSETSIWQFTRRVRVKLGKFFSG